MMAGLQAAEDTAAISVGFLALLFVSEPETWPVFLAWSDADADGPQLALRNRAHLEPLIENLRRKVMSK